MDQRRSRFYGRRHVDPDIYLQAIQIPHIPESIRIVQTYWSDIDNCQVINMQALERHFPRFHRIMVDGVHVQYLTPISPRRIRAYPGKVLQVILSSWDGCIPETFPDIRHSALRNDDDDNDGNERTSEPEDNLYYTDGDEDDNDASNWEGEFCLSSCDSFGVGHDLSGHGVDSTRTFFGSYVQPSAKSTACRIADSATFVSDNSTGQPPPTDNNFSSARQAAQSLRFSLPPPPLYLSCLASANDACIKVPRLNSTPQESTASRSTMPQHLFILPRGWKAGTPINKQTEAEFKLFRLCVCGANDIEKYTWPPHLLDEPRPDIRRPHQFIDLFAPTLLLGTRMFLASIRMPQSLAGLNATSLSAWPFADRHGAVQHIQEELSLFNVDAVEILLGQMIKYLEGLLSPRRGVTYAQPSFMSRHPILERSRLSLSDMALLSMYVDLGHPETPSAFLNFDMNGNDLWVCRHHYCYLDPGFRPNHIKHIVKQFGSYDAAAGKVNVHLRTSRGLAAVCGIDPFMAPRVSELNVALEWVSRPEKLNPLFKLAKDLDLTTLSMTGTSSGAGPSSASSHSMATRKADTAQVRDILHAQHPVTRVTINWDSDLDIPALLQEALSHKRVGPLFLTIKTGRQEVSSVMFKNHLGIQQVTADLDELPLKSEGSFLAGKLHNLTIGPTSFSTKVDQAAPWKTKVSSAIQENPALASLTISCEARDFRIILDSIHSILRELYKSSSFQRSLRFIFLKDTYSNITAKFNIAPLDCEEPAAIDATSGSNGPTLFSIVRNFGAFIRVLNLLDNSVANTYLLKEFARSKPTQLVSIMLTLERYVPRSGNDLSTIAILSKNTFKQLTLIGHPKDREALLSLLHAIRSLRGCQILLTRTGSASVKTWIKPAQRVIHRSSRLIVVESVEQMRLMVPELSASGFASLKNAFDRNKRFIVKRKKPKL